MSTGAFLNENSPLVFSTRTFSIIYDEQRILRLCVLKTDEIHVNKEILSVRICANMNTNKGNFS